MSRTTAFLPVLFVIGVVFVLANSGNVQLPAQSVTANPATSTRFQVSAYAAPRGDQYGHGCYIIDQLTGEVWHAQQGGPTVKVSETLR